LASLALAFGRPGKRARRQNRFYGDTSRPGSQAPPDSTPPSARQTRAAASTILEWVRATGAGAVY